MIASFFENELNIPTIIAIAKRNKGRSREEEYKISFFKIILTRQRRNKRNRIMSINQLDDGPDTPDVNGRIKTRIRIIIFMNLGILKLYG